MNGLLRLVLAIFELEFLCLERGELSAHFEELLLVGLDGGLELGDLALLVTHYY